MKDTFPLWAHPRLRGDHASAYTEDGKRKGSSPPARGPRKNLISKFSDRRLIPACAGTTRFRRSG